MIGIERIWLRSARSEKCSDCTTCNFQNPIISRTINPTDKYETSARRPWGILWSLTFHEANGTPERRVLHGPNACTPLELPKVRRNFYAITRWGRSQGKDVQLVNASGSNRYWLRVQEKVAKLGAVDGNGAESRSGNGDS